MTTILPKSCSFRTMIRCVGFAAVLGILAGPLDAQTFKPSAVWTMPDAPAITQSYVYTLRLGATVVPIGSVTCVAVSGATQCSAPLTGPLAAGAYTLTAANGFGAGPASDPFVGAAPGKPITFTITFTVTITP